MEEHRKKERRRTKWLDDKVRGDATLREDHW